MESNMFNEIIKIVVDILTGHKPAPDVLGPNDIERILKKRKKIKVITHKNRRHE